jgi:type I restriction enzyme M protein
MDQHHGRCAILLPHGVLNRLIERDLRKKLLEIDVVEAVISVGKNLFFNSPMEACILICRNNKSIERHGKILMIKATDLVERKNTESYLTEDHIRLISDIYTNYKEEEYRSVIVDVSTIDPKTYSISPKLYVKSLSQETEDADDLFAVWDDMTDSLHKDIDSLTKLFS